MSFNGHKNSFFLIPLGFAFLAFLGHCSKDEKKTDKSGSGSATGCPTTSNNTSTLTSGVTNTVTSVATSTFTSTNTNTSAFLAEDAFGLDVVVPAFSEITEVLNRIYASCLAHSPAPVSGGIDCANYDVVAPAFDSILTAVANVEPEISQQDAQKLYVWNAAGKPAPTNTSTYTGTSTGTSADPYAYGSEQGYSTGTSYTNSVPCP